MRVDRRAADEVLGVLKRVVEASADSREHADRLADHLSTDPVAGQQCDPKVGHQLVLVVVVSFVV